MRSLTDGVCIKLLTRPRHNQSSPLPALAASKMTLPIAAEIDARPVLHGEHGKLSENGFKEDST